MKYIKTYIKKIIVEEKMKVNYIGFGGTGNYPCYEDENGKIYFDLDNGHGELDLHTEHTDIPKMGIFAVNRLKELWKRLSARLLSKDIRGNLIIGC